MVAASVACEGPVARGIWDRHAEAAYRFAGIDPSDPPGTGALVLHLFGVTSIQRDEGMSHGEPVVIFGRPSWAAIDRPVGVLLGRGNPEQITYACAHACAQYVAWARDEAWSSADLRSVALAIAMPRAALDPILRRSRMTVFDIADEFAVSLSDAKERVIGIAREDDWPSGPRLVGS